LAPCRLSSQPFQAAMPDPRAERDAPIAATALDYSMTVVTRNTDDFEPTDVPLLNLWNEPPEIARDNAVSASELSVWLGKVVTIAL
jgi:hypothetical protein